MKIPAPSPTMKTGIEAMEGIGEQGQPSTNREEPERYGDHALLSLLRGNPLDQEAHGKERLPHKPDRQPELLVAHLVHPVGSRAVNGRRVTRPCAKRRMQGAGGSSRRARSEMIRYPISPRRTRSSKLW